MPGFEAAFLARLRDRILPDTMATEGLEAFVQGFRAEARDTSSLGLSVWRDWDSILRATEGHPDRPERNAPVSDLLDRIRIDHYELVDDAPRGLLSLDGAVIGVVDGTVLPNAEGAAFEMIRASRGVVEKLGVIGFHAGRRMAGRRSQIAVLAVWRDRAALRRFARQRDGALIDPRFTSLMEEWSFRTFGCLAPGRSLMPAAGAAVLLADDDGRYIEASAGVERVLGIPGELLIGRSISDLIPRDERVRQAELWRSFRETSEQEGSITLERPDGSRVEVRYRAATDVPEAGMHASVLSLPSDEPDVASVAGIVADAFLMYSQVA
jgi:PAS domain S-box-containing protein